MGQGESERGTRRAFTLGYVNFREQFYDTRLCGRDSKQGENPGGKETGKWNNRIGTEKKELRNKEKAGGCKKKGAISTGSVGY